jgi:hypothetical protein
LKEGIEPFHEPFANLRRQFPEVPPKPAFERYLGNA